jgi:nucleolar GTP-binding protein
MLMMHRQLDRIAAETGALFLSMSNMTEEGVMDVRNEACKLLLADRVARKSKGKKVCVGCSMPWCFQ